MALNDNDIYFNQFIAPTTGDYTKMTILSTKDTGTFASGVKMFTGSLGVAIYENKETNASEDNLGRPGLLKGYVIKGFTANSTLSRGYVDFTFTSPITLDANEKYWVAIISLMVIILQ